ncbi:ThuA domain-containing protein [Streptomyces sp. NPDC006617]|uniref:ThuA domain-containing protein n=1 Tax=Streptomyces sp. NPDC006617 TaxID=3155354 RepID=UPI00339FACDC
MTFQTLAFTRTTGYRHDSIPAGVQALRELGRAHGFRVHATEDPVIFERDLSRFAVIVFLSTSGEVLTDCGRDALRQHLESGGGFVGVHAAACTEFEWPYYGTMLGARFAGHPAYQPGRVVVEDGSHPATSHLNASWYFTDEWYNFRSNPRGAVHVLARVDEESYEGGAMGEDHPLVWCREHEAGRVFYTGLGHSARAYQDPDFRRHLLGGILWSARLGIDAD